MQHSPLFCENNEKIKISNKFQEKRNYEVLDQSGREKHDQPHHGI